MTTSAFQGGRGNRLRLALALLLTLAGAAGTAYFAYQTVPQSFDGQRANDFPNYYVAGLRLWEGRPIYTPHADEIQARLGFADYPTNIADSPFAVVCLAPLSRLPYPVAFFILYGFSLLAVPGVVFLCARALRAPAWAAWLAVGLTLFSNHYRFVLMFNHMESLLLCLLAGGWLCLRSGGERRGALLWGAAAALKLFPGLLILLLLAQRRWHAALWATAGAGTLMLLSALLIGWNSALAFVTEVIPYARNWYGRDYNVSLMSIGVRLGGGAFGWAMTLAALALTWRLSLRAGRDLDVLFVAGSAGMLLASPLSWIGYGVLLLPALVVVTKSVSPDDVAGRRLLLLALVFSQFWPFRSGYETPDLWRFLFYAVPPAIGYALLLFLGTFPGAPIACRATARRSVP